MKKLLALSTAAAIAVSGAMADQAADIAKLQKDVKRLKASLSEVKAHDGGDNIKWDVDFRTSVDNLSYKTASGAEYENDALFANRLWLGMGYAVSDNMVFKGQIAYNKAFGASPVNYGYDNTGTFPQRGYGYDSFDWVLNENLTDDTLKLREAYWLYKSNSLFGSDISWTASVGRRPTTNGFLANLREDDKAKSPLGHLINMEFDGASFKLGLDKVTGIDGMYVKLCLGRGLTNARARFNMDGGFASLGDYTKDNTTMEDVDFAGFIFVPYDDGQYSVETIAVRGFNVPGFNFVDVDNMMSSTSYGMIKFVDTGDQGVGAPAGTYDTMDFNSNVRMKTMGDIDGAAISFMANGIGDGISDFLDDTILFASVAATKTRPKNAGYDMDMDAVNAAIANYMAMGMTQAQAIEGFMAAVGAGTVNIQDYLVQEGMLGSTKSETGTSYWIGAQIPAMFTEDGRLGFEFNHGSKYWRSFTFGEDTMTGSKIATRGDAYEVYYTQPLMEGFSMQLRATQMNYDYTGSQGFFGSEGRPLTMAQAQAFGMDPVEKARDIRLYFRYRY